MMKNFFVHTMLWLTFCGAMSGCENIEDTYKDYAGDGPIQYLNKIYNLSATPQWESVLLSWDLKMDPGRTGILVEWKSETDTFSQVIDKNSKSFLVEGLTANYDYEFNVWAIMEQNGEIVKKSLGDAVYACPFNQDSNELSLFTHMVTKQIKVADSKLFVVFDSWPDNLVSFKIGYFEKGKGQEDFFEATESDRIDGWPKGKPYAIIGENIDFTKPVNVYRRGRIESFGNMELDLQPLNLYFDLPVFNSDFANELRLQLNLNGEIQFDDIQDVSSLNINFDQISLEDILYFPNLETVNLGKDRYIMAGTENEVKSSLQSDVKRQISLGALKLAHDVLNVEVNQYGRNYFDETPEWFTGRNLVPQLPALNLLDTSGWTLTETPKDVMGYETGLLNLLNDDNTNYWLPTASTQVREHIFEIDMGEARDICGFKVQQANIDDESLRLPSTMSINIMDASGTWTSATFSREIMIGNGKGEVSLIYLDKDKSVKHARKVRFTISDSFYKKDYDENYNYIDYYRTALSTFMIITE